jgi:hypothetical protein
MSDRATGSVWTHYDFDERLASNELVLGAGIGEIFTVFVLSESDGLSVVEDVIGEHPIVAFVDPDNLFGLAYSALVDGDKRTFNVADDQIIDDLGTTWNLDGLAVSGPAEGSQLGYVTSFVTEWYGWAAYHPTTDIHGRQ